MGTTEMKHTPVILETTYAWEGLDGNARIVKIHVFDFMESMQELGGLLDQGLKDELIDFEDFLLEDSVVIF